MWRRGRHLPGEWLHSMQTISFFVSLHDNEHGRHRDEDFQTDLATSSGAGRAPAGHNQSSHTDHGGLARAAAALQGHGGLRIADHQEGRGQFLLVL